MRLPLVAPALCCLVDTEPQRFFLTLQVQKVHIPADHSYIIFGCGE